MDYLAIQPDTPLRYGVTTMSIREHVPGFSNYSKRGKSNPLKHWHVGGGSHDWLSGPNVGDHFHLIYTPMKNKL